MNPTSWVSVALLSRASQVMSWRPLMVRVVPRTVISAVASGTIVPSLDMISVSSGPTVVGLVMSTAWAHAPAGSRATMATEASRFRVFVGMVSLLCLGPTGPMGWGWHCRSDTPHPHERVRRPRSGGAPKFFSLARAAQGQPASNSFWKARKSKMVSEPSPSKSARGSPASKRFW